MYIVWMLTLKEVSRVCDVFVLFVVAVPTHPDWQAILDGAAAIVAGHLGSAHVLTPSRTGLLVLTVRLHLTCSREETKQSLTPSYVNSAPVPIPQDITYQSSFLRSLENHKV